MGKRRKKPATEPRGSDTPLRDALSLWKLLNREGGLSPRTHDEKFVNDLRSALQIPSGEEVEAFLSRVQPDTTVFMLAVLNAFEPIGRMLSDIYAMFVRHGVKASDDRVLIEFDFGQAHDKLKFEADHFRKTLEKLSQLWQFIEAHQFTTADLRRISDGISEALADANGQPPTPHVWELVLGNSNQGKPIKLSSEPQSQAFARWIRSGQQNPGRIDRWPYLTPPPTPEWTPDDPIRKALMPLTMATVSLCAVSGRYPTLRAMRDAAEGAGALDEPGNSTRSTVASWSLPVAASSQSDQLAMYSLRLLWHVYELAPAETSAREELARHIADTIEEHSNRSEVLAPARVLEDLLDLPMWQFRHQIYSIWLVTVVERAFLDPDEFVLAGEDGRLVFAFKKTLVARLRARGVDMELISELRTSAGKVELTGEGRQGHVQPDYVVRRLDPDGKERIVFVLEAKQYARASLQNFSRALRDYAVVHKDSFVALANYGPMSKAIAEEVAALAASMSDEGVAERCAAFGHVEPTFPESVGALRNRIRSTISLLPPPPSLRRPTLIIDVSASMSDLLPDAEQGYRKGVWGAIEETGMPLLLTAEGLLAEFAGERSVEAAKLSRNHLQPGALSMEEVDHNRRKGALLLTDEAGLNETAAFHHELAAIIVLRSGDRASVYVNPRYREELEWTVPELLRSGAVEMLVLT